ncbi:M20 family metallo-hydrolase [Pantoea sp. B65]|uniref:M20 family metallo-hydrolase n=1 Tax=Pantoea sp. B65 TaxID=2813359 RepID=UPI0039B3C19A
MKINAARLWQRLMAIAADGAIEGGGVNRQALSAEEFAAWRRVLDWAAESGFEVCSDAVGNLFIILPGVDRHAAPLLLGSHLDSQPTGGRFDGVYGVLAALEVLTSLQENAIRPTCDLIAVSWMNEEGSRFAPGMMGSAWFAGQRELAAIRACHDADGISVGEALDRLHQVFPLPRYAYSQSPAAYFELHIEQAPLLEQANCPIGVVSGIQGKHTWQVEIRGESGHAGTVAMDTRRDALQAFTVLAGKLYQQIGQYDDRVMFTIGWLEMEPNAPSVIPQRVAFRVDLRHPDAAVLARLATLTATLIQQHSFCEVSLTPLSAAAPNTFDSGLQQQITDSAAGLNVASMPVLSAAGHDARYLATLCPTAMIFIPCRDGVSHAVSEWAEPEHVAAGAAVLLATLLSCRLPGWQLFR